MSLLNPAWRKLNPDDLKRLHHEENLSYAEMAERLGTTRDVVRYAMDRHRIPARKGKLSKEDKAMIRNLRQQGLTYREIAERYNIDTSTAYNVCHPKNRRKVREF